jgi:ADP-glucose pyrophosphorylase
MKIDDTGRVISFSEKPKGDDLKAMVGLVFSQPILM